MQQSEYRSYILYGKTKGAAKMNITDVRVRKVAKEGKMKAVVSITIDDEFVVHDIKVIEVRRGCLSQCQVGKLQTENTGTLHILLILQPATVSRESSWTSMMK